MKEFIEAHKYCTSNYEALKRSEKCGCFHCGKVFDPCEIEGFITETDGSKTALCPHCGIDAVIVEGNGYILSEDFLEEMRKYWF